MKIVKRKVYVSEKFTKRCDIKFYRDSERYLI